MIHFYFMFIRFRVKEKNKQLVWKTDLFFVLASFMVFDAFKSE